MPSPPSANRTAIPLMPKPFSFAHIWIHQASSSNPLTMMAPPTPSTSDIRILKNRKPPLSSNRRMGKRYPRRFTTSLKIRKYIRCQQNRRSCAATASATKPCLLSMTASSNHLFWTTASAATPYAKSPSPFSRPISASCSPRLLERNSQALAHPFSRRIANRT